MFWLLLILPLLANAQINISANSIKGDIASRNFTLFEVELDSPPWKLTAQKATTAEQCILISGKVFIENIQTHTKYSGNSFKYCPQTSALSSIGPVEIYRKNIKIQAKKMLVNLLRNQSQLEGVSLKNG